MLVQGREPAGFKASENPHIDFGSMLARAKRGGYAGGGGGGYASGGGGYSAPQCSELRRGAQGEGAAKMSRRTADCGSQSNRCPAGPPVECCGL